MEKENATLLTEFVLTGLIHQPLWKIPLFLVFLVIYLITIVGNVGLITLIWNDSHLHIPMYLFLGSLAFVDASISSIVVPKMLLNIFAKSKLISLSECMLQFFLFNISATTECFLLAAMAYDRYVAICKPLLYVIIMAGKVRWALVLVPYLYSIFVSLLLTIKLFTLSFCGSNVISYFYCDCVPLISLLCSDTRELELIILIFSGCNLLSSLLIVLISYVFIFVAILRMNSKEGRSKAFSTCSSHLTVVVVFYGTLLFIYLQPKSSHTFDVDKMASVFYTLVIPMLNPLIYSLRNKEVKEALKRTFTHGFRIPA